MSKELEERYNRAMSEIERTLTAIRATLNDKSEEV